MIERDVAPGIHRIENNHTNFYAVEDGDRVTVVDAGLPVSLSSLEKAVPLDRIEALILTHAHFDHIGIAEKLRQRGIPVYVHENDVPLAHSPRRYSHERARLVYYATQVQALPIVAGFVAAGALWPRPVQEVRRFGDEGTLDVPGSPRIVFTPGHTLGHVAFHFPDRDAVIAGDALVTFDPYVAMSRPKIVSRAATADSERNLRSLDALAATGATHVLTGHGPVWHDGVEAIVEQAREAPIT
jgi:glyoxylase-like metal-dependent hydrolase (beta-lactamase superfamily II)